MDRPTARSRRVLRCAIYTRKSSEEGLEQEFNSLHAQREACEAFIKSQRHEGWICLPQHYDDGGLSGATMERPGLQQLLADIQSGGVDVLVCYKVDRLTRSLADFAKIVEIFDGKGVSFVSVTRQFNTTTSMGRLTLNVLLSFAQFEREVTGERIRDKIAASKRKGMWMGGVPPLGYAAREHKLLVVESEAETVRHIFQRYLALASVRLLRQDLQAQGIVGKRWTSAAGRCWGGKPLGRSALYRMLQNRIYRGEIVHRELSYPAEHQPIIDAVPWDAVQTKLASNAADRQNGTRAKNPSLLAGLLFDSKGHGMTPTHAAKNGTRYRYYVSRPLICDKREDAPDGLRIPAGEIERVVTDAIGNLLADPGRLTQALEPRLGTAGEQQRLLRRAAELARTWSELPRAQLRTIIAGVIQRVDVHNERLDIETAVAGLARVLGDPESTDPAGANKPGFKISVASALRRLGQGKRMLVDAPNMGGRATEPDPKLIQVLSRAHRLKDQLIGDRSHIVDIAQREKLSPSYVTRLLRLTSLAPDITAAILQGRQPKSLTAYRLLASPLPPSWPAQRDALGFGTGADFRGRTNPH